MSGTAMSKDALLFGVAQRAAGDIRARIHVDQIKNNIRSDLGANGLPSEPADVERSFALAERLIYPSPPT